MSRIEKIQTMLEKEPDDAFLNYSMALELAKLERFEESVARFDMLLAVAPDYVAGYFHKGKTLAAMGWIPDARETIVQGIAKATEVGNSHARGEMEEFLAGLE